jgi:hypothetical protein
MAASVTLIVVGIMLLAGGEWNAGYAVVFIVAGAAAWHVCEHARRGRGAVGEKLSPRLSAARKTLGALAALLEIAAVLAIGAYAFDRPETGLFNGFSLNALLGATAFGAALFIAAAQAHALKARLSEEALARFSPSRGNS